jgi:hypothetical protein
MYIYIKVFRNEDHTYVKIIHVAQLNFKSEIRNFERIQLIHNSQKVFFCRFCHLSFQRQGEINSSIQVRRNVFKIVGGEPHEAPPWLAPSDKFFS